MIYKHFSKVPEAYDIEWRIDGYVNVWLCRQIDTYLVGDIREYDVDVRVVWGIEPTPELEANIRANWSAWWEMACKPDQ